MQCTGNENHANNGSNTVTLLLEFHRNGEVETCKFGEKAHVCIKISFLLTGHLYKFFSVSYVNLAKPCITGRCLRLTYSKILLNSHAIQVK